MFYADGNAARLDYHNRDRQALLLPCPISCEERAVGALTARGRSLLSAACRSHVRNLQQRAAFHERDHMPRTKFREDWTHKHPGLGARMGRRLHLREVVMRDRSTVNGNRTVWGVDPAGCSRSGRSMAAAGALEINAASYSSVAFDLKMGWTTRLAPSHGGCHNHPNPWPLLP